MPIRPENRARYPHDWKRRSYFVRFVRAQGRCEWCGAEHGRTHPITGSTVVLTTAHVFDHRPEAASLLNLAALCHMVEGFHTTPRLALLSLRAMRVSTHASQLFRNKGRPSGRGRESVDSYRSLHEIKGTPDDTPHCR